MEAEGGKESDGGRRKGGREIEEGGREGGGAMEGGSNGGVGSKTSLTRARRRPCPFMRAGHRSRAFISCTVVFVRFRSWACVLVHGHSLSFVGGQLCLWVCVSVWWYAGGGLVVCCGLSCCSRVVAGGVSFVVVGHVM